MSGRVIQSRGYLEYDGLVVPLDRAVAFTEITGSQRHILAQSASDSALAFGPVTTATVVYLESDVAVTYKLNGTGNTAITLSAGGKHLLSGCSVTSIHFSESGASAAILKYIIAGS